MSQKVKCVICLELKDEKEDFYWLYYKKEKKYRRMRRCKECDKKISKKHYQDNIDRERKKRKEWQDKNMENHLSHQREYYARLRKKEPYYNKEVVFEIGNEILQGYIQKRNKNFSYIKQTEEDVKIKECYKISNNKIKFKEA